jgi:phytoene dehydrogenase-like protein
MSEYDAVVVGSGPNGLAAAVTLGQYGLKVLVLEARATVGGGSRTAAVTLPGFQHDICSAVHPLGIGSPFFRTLPLADFGLTWVQPAVPVAHPFADGTAVALYRSLEQTAAALGPDGASYRRLLEPLVARWDELLADMLGPLGLPRSPILMARFGLRALWPVESLIKRLFRHEPARALLAGIAAHSALPLDKPLSAAFGLVLGLMGHATGWPVAQGGSQRIADALAAYLKTLGGEVITGHEVVTLADVPPARAILLDVTPRQLLQMAGSRLPPGYRRRLERYRYGLGVFKVDWALAGPIPWRAQVCRRAGTIHLGATVAEMAESERLAWQGKLAERPYVLVAQQSLFDDSRAPNGQHTGWAYCHTPHGSPVDMTAAIEYQIERFAPGFRDLILARQTMTAVDMQQYNANYVGGDINGGVQDLLQLFTRPVTRADPYTTPLPHLFLCSSATPPGGGVHGMCGYHAARSALKRCFR